MPASILLVDTDETALAGLPEELLAKYPLRLATSYKDALKALADKDPCALVVAELGLNQENGIKFLRHVRKHHPGTVRMVISDRTDFSETLEALNKARVRNYIHKPCPPDELARVIVRGLRHYKEKREQQRAMRKALIGSVHALVDILDLVNPEAMGFAKRIRERVMTVGKQLGVKPLWHLELAVMLSHIGCVALPSEILVKMDKGEKLNPEERQIFGMHPSIASNLLDNIDQMAPVAEIIRHQHDFLNGDQPLGARIIKVALDMDRFERKGADPLRILDKMCTKSKLYDQDVVKVMRRLLSAKNGSDVREVSVEDIEEGMVMAQDLINKDGVKLLLRGQAITKASLVRLKSFHVALGILDPLLVTAEAAQPPPTAKS